MLIAYHSETKPWGIKAVCLFVIFTFLLTQSDVQLGFANGMAPGAPATPVLDLNKSDKIHYDNFTTTTANEPTAETSDLTRPPGPKTEEPPVQSTLGLLNPLKNAGNVVELESVTVNGITKHTFQDGTSYSVDAEDKGRITEIIDFVYGVDGKIVLDSEESKKKEKRIFIYGQADTLQINTFESVFVSADGRSDVYDLSGAFEKYQLDVNGNLGDILNSGLVGHEDLPMGIYDSAANNAVFYEYDNDPTDYKMWTYEWKAATAGAEREVGRMTGFCGSARWIRSMFRISILMAKT